MGCCEVHRSTKFHVCQRFWLVHVLHNHASSIFLRCGMYLCVLLTNKVNYENNCWNTVVNICHFNRLYPGIRIESIDVNNGIPTFVLIINFVGKQCT